jgi:hypothetical protein
MPSGGVVVKSLLCCQASRCPKIQKKTTIPPPPPKCYLIYFFLEIYFYFLRRATLRKVAQVTPPPSPKNGEDVKGHSEWSTRLRNHSVPAGAKVANGRRSKIVRIKKESPVFHHNEDSNCSRTSVISFKIYLNFLNRFKLNPKLNFTDSIPRL